MKKMFILAPALLAACSLALPLSAAALQGALDGTVTGSHQNSNVNGNVNANAQAERNAAPVSTGDNARDRVKAERIRVEGSLRSEYRGFHRRLDRVEDRIEDAEQHGRLSAERADKERAKVNEVRARFKMDADKSAHKLSSADKKSMEASVKAEEEAMVKAEKDNDNDDQ